MTALRLGMTLCALAACAAVAIPAWADEPADSGARKAFRVCKDPNNLPYSNDRNEGYEDKIAALFAKDLGLPLVDYSYPSRFAFIRNTLRYKLPGVDFPCDIVLGVPAGFDQVSATKPYYHSTYALLVPQGRGLDGVRTEQDFLALPEATLKHLRIGVFDQSPGSMWLVKHKLLDQGVPYKMLIANLDTTAARIIDGDLVSGKIDVAIVWGPIAGYYAKKATAPKLAVVPLKSEKDVKFDYEIAMGVRYGEKEWKQQVEQLIDRNMAQIHAILLDYGVPLVDGSGDLVH